MANDERMTHPRQLKARADFQDFWVAGEPPSQQEEGVLRETPEQKAPLSFDLEERTARFGETILRFAKRIPQGPVNNRLIDQLVGAGTGIGANYCEADDAVSKREFLVKINTCRKEARETKFFLRMVAVSEEALKPQARTLWQEAKELHLIFCAILRNAK
jgi:four helix bundle protein